MAGTPKLPILIVGAGPTGLTLAIELLRHGVTPRLIERASVPSERPKALGVLPRTLEMLTPSGVAHDMLANGVRVSTFSIWSSGRQLAHLDFAEGVTTRFPFTLMLPQPTTEAILTAHLLALGGHVERASELIGMTQRPEAVEAIVRHGDASEERTRASFVVGCDGAHSAVRHLLAVPFAGAAIAQHFTTGVVRMHWSLPYDQALAFLNRGHLIAYFPLPDGYHQFLGVSSSGAVPEDAITLDEIQRMVDECGPTGARATDLSQHARYHVHQRRVTRYVHQRVLLAGDAAHVHSPLAAQGMNTGIQDALNLGWKLAQVAQERAPLSLLHSYHQERAQVGAAKLFEDAALTRLGFLRHALPVSVRDGLAPLFLRHRTIRRFITDRATGLGIAYTHGPLVVNGRLALATRASFGLAAGHRAPDGELAPSAGTAPVQLHDLLSGTRHVLLAFAARHDDPRLRTLRLVLSAWRQRPELIVIHRFDAGDPAEHVWRDADGHLAARYGIAAEGLVLIRPDGYIAFLSRSLSAAPLRRYLLANYLANGNE